MEDDRAEAAIGALSRYTCALSMPTDDPRLLAREAARTLAEAIAVVSGHHGREPRERHRQLLARAIDQAERAIAASQGAPIPRAQTILAKAYAARADDALHGARQISLGAQRAPTIDACEDGWRRVASLVAIVEEAARHAAGRADDTARAARALLDERNHAYTFHTDHGFSFGEGWYLAAAAVLSGATIQIEPGLPGTPQAERFLRDAGVADRLQPYRSRPRANKQTTEIVARAFRADPIGAQRKLRAAFLGAEPIAPAVSAWIEPRLVGLRDRKKVLVWIRDGAHHPGRNTQHAELRELVGRAERAGLVPIVVGDALRDGALPPIAVDMMLFWKDPIFRGVDGRRAQLQFFEHLREAHGVVGQLGVTTAGMDGPALMGMRTMYLTDTSNVRMREWVGAVPGYVEIVRERGYLDRISRALLEWSAGPVTATTSSAALR